MKSLNKMSKLILLATLVIASLLVAPFARAQIVVATVGVGTDPYDLAYDFTKGEVFVANRGTGTVSVISDGTVTQCRESDGNGDFHGANGKGNFHADDDRCEDGIPNQVSSSNLGDGKDFQSTQISTTTF